MTETPTILVRVEPAVGEDPDDLDDLADKLRPLAAVVPQSDSPSRKFYAVELVAVLGSAGAIKALADVLNSYLRAKSGRKATLEYGDRRIKLEGYSGAEIERIMHELESKH